MNAYRPPDEHLIDPDAKIPFVSDQGDLMRPGYVAGHCGHAVADQEWDAGFRNCERCPHDEDCWCELQRWAKRGRE